jgi:hypothetical protein
MAERGACSGTDVVVRTAELIEALPYSRSQVSHALTYLRLHKQVVSPAKGQHQLLDEWDPL